MEIVKEMIRLAFGGCSSGDGRIGILGQWIHFFFIFFYTGDFLFPFQMPHQIEVRIQDDSRIILKLSEPSITGCAEKSPNCPILVVMIYNGSSEFDFADCTPEILCLE